MITHRTHVDTDCKPFESGGAPLNKRQLQPVTLLLSTLAVLTLLLLAVIQPESPHENPNYAGQSVVELLRNPQSPKRPSTIGQLLTLRLVTNNPPNTVAFEVPVNYDSLTNKGWLYLFADGDENGTRASGKQASDPDCFRATNGDCLLVWLTDEFPPGPHRLQAELNLVGEKTIKDGRFFRGPAFQYYLPKNAQNQ